MAEFTRDELRNLVAVQPGPLVTIVMPVERTDTSQQLNHSRFRHLRQRAEEMLEAMEFKRADIDTMLAPAQALIDDNSIFHGQGLALFIPPDPDQFRLYNVDIPLEEKVVVGDRFYIKQLTPALIYNQPFYLLKLSQREAKLLEGTGKTLREIEVPGMPENIQDALMLENEGRNEGVFAVGASGRPDAPGTPTGIGGQSGSYAGHGAGEEDIKQYLVQYFHKVNNAVHPVLRDKTAPLVLVAVDYLHPLYKGANTYPHLTKEGILGNPASFTSQDLVERAHAVVDPIFRQGQADAEGHYHDFLHLNKASNRPLDVLQAAYMGRVDSLFVPLDREMWGTYDFNTNKLEVHDDQEPGDVDLLDLAAAQTILTDGKVYAVPHDQMPDHATIAGVYRYIL